ncbi:MAG: hypothetical protein WCV50_00695 [Patescibacteria group bacterium]|jgi:hypothetical protein
MQLANENFSNLKRNISNICLGILLGFTSIYIAIGTFTLFIQNANLITFLPHLIGLILGIITLTIYLRFSKTHTLFDSLVMLSCGIFIGYWVTGTILIIVSYIIPGIADSVETFFHDVDKIILYFFIQIGWLPLCVGFFIWLKDKFKWSVNKTVVVGFIVLFLILFLVLTPRVSDYFLELQKNNTSMAETITLIIINHAWLHLIINMLIGASLVTYALSLITNKILLHSPKTNKII